MLAAAAGDVVSQQRLIEEVWSASFVSVNVVSQVIGELRRALCDDARRPTYIQNVPRRGYRLVASVSFLDADRQSNRGDGTRFVLTSPLATHALQAGENVIGRSATADIRIDAPQASRRHARIVVGPRGATIEDLGSKNGTLVNGRRIAGPQLLVEGDEVQLGSPAARFRFRRAEEPTRTAPVAL